MPQNALFLFTNCKNYQTGISALSIIVLWWWSSHSNLYVSFLLRIPVIYKRLL